MRLAGFKRSQGRSFDVFLGVGGCIYLGYDLIDSGVSVLHEMSRFGVDVALHMTILALKSPNFVFFSSTNFLSASRNLKTPL